jgi:hypothetical protein
MQMLDGEKMKESMSAYGARFHHGFCCVRVRVIGLRLLYGAHFRRKLYKIKISDGAIHCTARSAIELHAFAPVEALGMRVAPMVNFVVVRSSYRLALYIPSKLWKATATQIATLTLTLTINSVQTLEGTGDVCRT